MSNAVYWLVNPLEESSLRVLKKIKNGTQPFFKDPFEVAYLISEECAQADFEQYQLTITEKGLEGLEFFGEGNGLDSYKIE